MAFELKFVQDVQNVQPLRSVQAVQRRKWVKDSDQDLFEVCARQRRYLHWVFEAKQGHSLVRPGEDLYEARSNRSSRSIALLRSKRSRSEHQRPHGYAMSADLKQLRLAGCQEDSLVRPSTTLAVNELPFRRPDA